MAVFSNESRSSLNVTITDCIFEKNYARSFGGGMYLLSGGVSAHHKMLVQRSHFDSNTAGIGAGGVHVTFANSALEDDPLLVSIIDCQFCNNMASHNGGGVYVSSHTDGMLWGVPGPSPLFSHPFQKYASSLDTSISSSLDTSISLSLDTSISQIVQFISTLLWSVL